MLTRRHFILSSIGQVVRIAVADANVTYRTRVCIVRTSDVWKGSGLNSQVIRTMLDEGIKLLTGADDVSKSWRKLFNPTDTVALKVNPIARSKGSTKPELSYALVQTIHENIGVPLDKFIIYDVSNDDLKGARYVPTREKGKVQVFASDQYSSFISKGGVKAKITNIVTDKCSALINVPLLKTHVGPGITVSLKNHYGSIPAEVVQNDSYNYHSNEYRNLIFLNLMGPIREKERLIVVDGLMAQFHLGPEGDHRYQWKFNGIILGTDPLAVDTVCLGIVNEKRKQASLQPVQLPYLDLGREEGLGTNLMKEIEVLSKTM